MKLDVVSIRDHPRGRICEVKAGRKVVRIRFSFHALQRITTWQITERKVLEALLSPDEVVRGHRNRFIAHRRYGSHLVRAVYEYEGNTPVVITVYFPSAERYFQGGRSHEDQILS